MKFSTLTLVCVMCVAMPAMAQFTTVQLAHEVRLSSIRLPASESGTLAFKACATCDTKSVRVNADTRWLVNRRSVSLSDFRKAAERIQNRNETSVTVKQHLENNLITKVSIIVR